MGRQGLAPLAWIGLVLLAACSGGGEEPAPSPPSSASEALQPEIPLQEQAPAEEPEPAPPPAPAVDISGLPRSRSQLVFPSPDLDLGEVYQDRYPVEFPFRIEGPDPVVVGEVRATCGCTEVRLEIGGEAWPLGTPIPPGSEGRVAGTFDLRRLRHQKSSIVTVRSTAANALVELKMRAVALPWFECEPPTAFFGTLDLADLRAGDVERLVWVRGRSEFEILRWVDVPEGVAVEETGRSEGDGEGRQRRELRVRLLPDAPSGLILGGARAETSLGAELEVLVQATVRGPIQYHPSGRIVFQARPGVEWPERVLQILPGAGVEIPAPELSLEGDPVFETALREKPSGRGYAVELRLRSGTPAGHHEALLRIRYPLRRDLPEHKVTLVAMVQEGA